MISFCSFSISLIFSSSLLVKFSNFKLYLSKNLIISSFLLSLLIFISSFFSPSFFLSFWSSLSSFLSCFISFFFPSFGSFSILSSFFLFSSSFFLISSSFFLFSSFFFLFSSSFFLFSSSFFLISSSFFLFSSSFFLFSSSFFLLSSSFIKFISTVCGCDELFFSLRSFFNISFSSFVILVNLSISVSVKENKVLPSSFQSFKVLSEKFNLSFKNLTISSLLLLLSIFNSLFSFSVLNSFKNTIIFSFSDSEIPSKDFISSSVKVKNDSPSNS